MEKDRKRRQKKDKKVTKKKENKKLEEKPTTGKIIKKKNKGKEKMVDLINTTIGFHQRMRMKRLLKRSKICCLQVD